MSESAQSSQIRGHRGDRVFVVTTGFTHPAHYAYGYAPYASCNPFICIWPKLSIYNLEANLMKTNPTSLLLAGLIAVLGAGCTSTPPTVGQQMITQSKDTKDLGKQWKNGQDIVARGEKLKSEGRDMIALGEQKVKEGERLVTEGNAAMHESELIFKERFPGQTLVPTE